MLIPLAPLCDSHAEHIVHECMPPADAVFSGVVKRSDDEDNSLEIRVSQVPRVPLSEPLEC